MAGYQTQSAQMLENLSTQFNSNEDIPMLSELFSKVMVISAKNNFDTRTPKSYKKPNQKSFFSIEHREAFKNHEKICKIWRNEGRPLNKDHPIRLAKVESQRKLQRITRTEKSANEQKNHEELMSTFSQNISQVCRKLNKIRGEKSRSLDLPYIETLNGKYSGENILEGNIMQF